MLRVEYFVIVKWFIFEGICNVLGLMWRVFLVLFMLDLKRKKRIGEEIVRVDGVFRVN